MRIFVKFVFKINIFWKKVLLTAHRKYVNNVRTNSILYKKIYV